MIFRWLLPLSALLLFLLRWATTRIAAVVAFAGSVAPNSASLLAVFLFFHHRLEVPVPGILAASTAFFLFAIGLQQALLVVVVVGCQIGFDRRRFGRRRRGRRTATEKSSALFVVVVAIATVVVSGGFRLLRHLRFLFLLAASKGWNYKAGSTGGRASVRVISPVVVRPGGLVGNGAAAVLVRALEQGTPSVVRRQGREAVPVVVGIGKGGVEARCIGGFFLGWHAKRVPRVTVVGRHSLLLCKVLPAVAMSAAPGGGIRFDSLRFDSLRFDSLRSARVWRGSETSRC